MVPGYHPPPYQEKKALKSILWVRVFVSQNNLTEMLVPKPREVIVWKERDPKHDLIHDKNNKQKNKINSMGPKKNTLEPFLKDQLTK